MYFNPLFIQNVNVEGSVHGIKQMKLSKDSYLFSDIIKLNYEKTKMEEGEFFSPVNLGELQSTATTGTVIKKEELLDSFLGMPTLEMFTIVEPKVLNSLVERVFQANSAASGTEELFALNKDVDISSALKSEIYGNEEKLVEFLEQLLPGMALVNTNNLNSNAGKESSAVSGNKLPLLPLPEKENVIEDVLRRLKSGETVQIVAKVGQEKIKLDISKIAAPDEDIKISSGNFNEKLKSLSLPSTETASAKVAAKGESILVNENTPGEKDNIPVEKNNFETTSLKENTILTKDAYQIPGREKIEIKAEETNTLKPAPVVKKTVEMPAAEMSEGEKSHGEKNLNKVSMTEKESPALNKISSEKINREPKVEENGKEQKSGETGENTPSKEIEAATKKIMNQKIVNKEILKPEISKEVIAEDKNLKTPSLKPTETKENREYLTENKPGENKPGENKFEELLPKFKVRSEGKETEKLNLRQKDGNNPSEKINDIKVNALEVTKMGIQSKTVKPFDKSLKENSIKDRYKIEISQEKGDDEAQKVLRTSELGVDNLLNYKKQASKLDNSPINQNTEVKNPEGSESFEKIVSQEMKKGDSKPEKSALEVKSAPLPEKGINSRTLSGAEKVFKSTTPFKEVIKTIKGSEVIKELKTFFQAGEHKSMILKLMPENLGKMRIILDVQENQHVRANIEVENEAVKQLMLSNVDSLKQSITQSGVQIGSFNISLSNPEQKMKKEFEQKKKDGSVAGGVENNEAAEEVREKKLGYNTYEYLA